MVGDKVSISLEIQQPAPSLPAVTTTRIQGNKMSTAQTTTNKATYGRLLDAVNSGDAEFISKTGTHQGEYMGRPPTGKPVAYDEIFIVRFANGRIAEMWGIVDVPSQMNSLA